MSFVNSLHFFVCKSAHAIPAFPACYACLAINYIWRVYWYVFPSTPRIYRKFLWLWKCWVRNDRRTIFQYLNSFFQEVNLMFQFFNFIQKFFLLHVNLFLFIPAFPALHTSFARIVPKFMSESIGTTCNHNCKFSVLKLQLQLFICISAISRIFTFELMSQSAQSHTSFCVLRC